MQQHYNIPLELLHAVQEVVVPLRCWKKVAGFLERNIVLPLREVQIEAWGFVIAQGDRGNHSTQEFTVTVLTQTAGQRLKQEGEIVRLVVSANVQDISGTHIMKGKVGRKDIQQWNSGKGPLLMSDLILINSPKVEDGTEADLQALGEMLPKAKVDRKMKEKVLKHEQSFNGAAVVLEGNKAPATSASQAALPKGR